MNLFLTNIKNLHASYVLPFCFVSTGYPKLFNYPKLSRSVTSLNGLEDVCEKNGEGNGHRHCSDVTCHPAVHEAPALLAKQLPQRRQHRKIGFKHPIQKFETSLE